MPRLVGDRVFRLV